VGKVDFEFLTSAINNATFCRTQTRSHLEDRNTVKESTVYEIITEGRSAVILPARPMELQMAMECHILGLGYAYAVASSDIQYAIKVGLLAKGCNPDEVNFIVAAFRGGRDHRSDSAEIESDAKRAQVALGKIFKELSGAESTFLKVTLRQICRRKYHPILILPENAASELKIEFSRLRQISGQDFWFPLSGLTTFQEPLQIGPNGSFHWVFDAPEDMVLHAALRPSNWNEADCSSNLSQGRFHVYVSPPGKIKIMQQRKKQGIERGSDKYSWKLTFSVPKGIRWILMAASIYFALLSHAMFGSENQSNFPVASVGIFAAGLIGLMVASKPSAIARPFILWNVSAILVSPLIAVLAVVNSPIVNWVGSLDGINWVLALGYGVAVLSLVREALIFVKIRGFKRNLRVILVSRNV
jgi:hypothetical protein